MDLLLTRDLFAVDNLLVLFICLNYHSLYAYRLQGVPRATMLSPRSIAILAFAVFFYRVSWSADSIVTCNNARHIFHESLSRVP